MSNMFEQSLIDTILPLMYCNPEHHWRYDSYNIISRNSDEFKLDVGFIVLKGVCRQFCFKREFNERQNPHRKMYMYVGIYRRQIYTYKCGGLLNNYFNILQHKFHEQHNYFKINN